MDQQNMAPNSGARNNIEQIAAQIAPHLAAILALLTPPPERDDDLLPEKEVCRLACCSPRTLAEARRQGLAWHGRQRDRAYRRSDVMAWIASRRVVHTEIDDDDLRKRMKRLREQRGAAKRGGK